MTAFYIGQHEIDDDAAFADYLKQTIPFIEKHGGRYLTKAGTHEMMARTRCGVRRLPRFIARPVTCVQSNFSSAIPSWKALSDISGLRWMTL